VVHDDEVDPVDFMIRLNRARVRWLLIGRQALIHYGVPAQTMDYDLWIDATPANVAKLLRVARDAGLDAPASATELETRPLFSLLGGTTKFDVFKARKFTNLDGETIDFAGAYSRRTVARAEGDSLAAPLPSLADLKLLKRMRDSAKDREDLRYLDLLDKRGRAAKTRPRRKR
jgi:hypothetical protein